VNVILLYWMLHKRGHLQADARFKGKALRIIAAGALMGIVLSLLNPIADPHMAKDAVERIAALALLCGAGAVVYGIAVLALGAVNLGELRTQFTRKAK
jgi:putative peptidoglycan lipid II flippase